MPNISLTATNIGKWIDHNEIDHTDFFSGDLVNSCPANYFECKDKMKCILIRQFCDKKFDCEDQSDEGEYCGEF